MNKNKLIISLLILATIGIGVVIAQDFFPKNIQSTGRVFIKTVEIEAYSDPGTTTVLNSLDWGDLSLDTINTEIIYLKNTGNVPVTLSMIVDNWSPNDADAFITLTWDVESATVNPSGVMPATLTLTVMGNSPPMNFSMDITLVGTE